MREQIVKACLGEIQHLWLSNLEASRPESMWIALHEPIPNTNEPETAVMNAWFLDQTGLTRRQASDYVRFIGIHSGRGWASGTSVPPALGVFNSRPGRIHSIGLAAFALVEESETIYLHYIFGGRTGRGSLYKFTDAIASLECTKNLWLL